MEIPSSIYSKNNISKIYLKSTSNDFKKEIWEFFKYQPKEENGFGNSFYDMKEEDFYKNGLNILFDREKGIGIKKVMYQKLFFSYFLTIK